MNRIDIIIMAYRNLWRRKVRAILTILGVLIGTMAIVVMISIGVGLEQAQRKMFESWGNLNLVTVYQGRGYNRDTGEMMSEEHLLDDDAVAAFEQYPGVMAVAPVYNIGVEAKFGKAQGWVNLIGMDPAKMELMELKALEGRLPTELDRNMVIVGYRVRENFWDESEMRMRRYEYEPKNSLEMMNKLINMTFYKYDDRNGTSTTKRQSVQVIGVLDGETSDKAWNVYANIEDVRNWRKYTNTTNYSYYYDPYGGSGTTLTASEQRKRDEQYSHIMIRCKDAGAARNLSKSLRDLSYNADSIADYLEGIEQQMLIVQAVLGGIGAITLLVASIGIANTMVMSIYERTREIGVMKVVGASGGDVQSLFLMEAGLIGVFGGVIGLGASYGFSKIINYFLAGSLGYNIGNVPPDISVIPLWLALFALVFAFFVGIVAGWFPARRATRLSPITAIRNE